jgi:hypothetical protein
VIIQLRACPALMVPVEVVQSPEKVGALNPGGSDSVIVKLPGRNVTTRVTPTSILNEGG